MDLEDWSSRLKVFADATRVRLLTLLEQEELTVAELSAITDSHNRASLPIWPNLKKLG